MNGMLSTRLRWCVPGTVAAAIAAASLVTSVHANASGHPDLPAHTAQQLLSTLAKATPQAMSGTIVQTTELGLPDLPANIGGGSGADADLSLQTFVSGSHTLRVFYGGATEQRVALLGQMSETDVVHNGTDLWSYSSSTRVVTHDTLTDSDAHQGTAPSHAGAADDLTPDQAAHQVLAAIDPTTTITIDRTAYVAGRSAYQLLLTPKDAHSLVGSVRIALDAKTSVPLRVQVFAKGASSPAIQVGFTDISFSKPDASIFHFTPPAGATVKQNALPFSVDTTDGEHVQSVTPPKNGTSSTAPMPNSGGLTKAASHTTVIGTGWAAVAEITGSAQSGQLGGLLQQMSSPVAGGRLISSALVSVLVTDDGRILVGAVPGNDLQQVADSGRPL